MEIREKVRLTKHPSRGLMNGSINAQRDRLLDRLLDGRSINAERDRLLDGRSKGSKILSNTRNRDARIQNNKNKSIRTTMHLKCVFWDVLGYFGTIRKTF